MTHDVVGLGNALVDALVRIEDEAILSQLELTRGQMHPVDDERWQAVYDQLEGLGATLATGGSCANTIAALGMMGAKACFAGQVGDDRFGALYAQQMEECCGVHALQVSEAMATGKCLSIISAKDAERTMLTDLGAAVALSGLGGFEARLRSSRLLHLTGYLFLGGPMAETAWEAIRVAEAAGVPISLDVADPFVIGAVGDAIHKVLADHASIAFVNEEEARALTGLDAEPAAWELSKLLETTVVKTGRKGSIIIQNGELTRVGVHTVDALDTTGAGDAYAAGYLYGWLRDWDPALAGDLGARIASLVVAQVGAVCRQPDMLRAAVRAVEEVP